MRRRICLVGAALGAFPLAFGINAALAVGAKPKPATNLIKIKCVSNVAVAVPPGVTYVVPPPSNGKEYGTTSCKKPLGKGIQQDSFNVPDSGDTLAKFKLYFGTGSIRGTYDLTPQEGSFTNVNFSETDWLGTLKVTGGTGTFAGAKGKGTMKCVTLDGVHTTCTDKLKLKQL